MNMPNAEGYKNEEMALTQEMITPATPGAQVQLPAQIEQALNDVLSQIPETAA